MASLETVYASGIPVSLIHLSTLDIESLAERKVITQPGGGGLIALAPYGVKIDPFRVVEQWKEED